MYGGLRGRRFLNGRRRDEVRQNCVRLNETGGVRQENIYLRLSPKDKGLSVRGAAG